MTDPSLQRRLAAIVVADVVGYSRLMEADEVATVENLRVLRSGVIKPAVTFHNGRIFKIVGDGFLIEFAKACRAKPDSGFPNQLIRDSFCPWKEPHHGQAASDRVA